ncbi:MAG TPA: Zn-dependent hydrolase [Gemmatimonadales bacterium]|nr:Zn-dependent hydrolase [Gemmatimonadales bacterium]
MGIDRAALERRLDELYAIGAQPDGGTYRGLYDDAWVMAVERVERWFKDTGLQTRRDAVGNLWGRVEGRDKGKSVVTGSHIDTVRRGGRLDGALGIVAGLTAVESLLKEKGKPRRTVEVVAICEEEGSRFKTNFWGSRAITGAIDSVDPEIAAAMRSRGLDPARVASAARDDIDTFVELHIEQGAVLESAGVPLAIVGSIVGTVHLELVVTGRADHAGTTPMTLRQDALAGAAAMIHGIESIARALGAPAVATVGKIRAQPDQMNVIPGEVVFTVDLRHADLGARRALENRIRSICATVGSERGLALEIRMLQEKPPVPMHPEIKAVLERAAKDLGVQSTELVSGAGHDAQILAARAKVGMMFVPSVGGRSHCPEESTKPEHLELGTNVLRQALQIIAY